MRGLLTRLSLWCALPVLALFPGKKGIASALGKGPEALRRPGVPLDKPLYLEHARELYGDQTSYKFAGHRFHRSHMSHRSHYSSSYAPPPSPSLQDRDAQSPPRQEPERLIAPPRPVPTPPPAERLSPPPSGSRGSERGGIQVEDLSEPRLQPKRPPTEDFMRRGLTASRVGRYPEAASMYLRAIAAEPLNFMAHNNLGVVYSKTGDSDRAESAFRRAIEINPNYADAYYNLGVVLSEKGNTKQAIYFLERSCSAGLSDGCQLLKSLKGNEFELP